MSNTHDNRDEDHVADERDEDELPPAEGDLYGVLAEFDTPGELKEAAHKVKDAGYTDFDCYSPFPVHGIDEAMGIKRTILPLITFAGGLSGCFLGLLLEWYCNTYRWGWNISGKPTWSIPANIPIGFETTILLSVLATFFGMWGLNKLPQVWHPLFRSDRFNRVTDDGFFLAIEAKDRRFDAEVTVKLLKDAGALEVENVFLDPDPKNKRLPKWLFAFIVASTAFALVPLVVAAKARNSKSSEPHIHIFPDMDFQPKYKSDQAMDLFPDGRENRGDLDGTVSRDPASLKADEQFYFGLDKGAWITGFPAAVTVDQRFMERGRNRFNIYCTPCHGMDGQGMGTVPARIAKSGGSWNVRNLTDPGIAASKLVITMPNGQLFNTISNGFSTMQGYAQQIPHRDRWAIVAYVRALQRAHNASEAEVPAADKANIK